MQQELRFATFNVCNLALPDMKYYEEQPPYSVEEYDAKTTWIAQQLDKLEADVIGLQEIFAQAAVKDVLAKTQKYRHAQHIGFDPDPNAERLTPSVALISRLPIEPAPAAYTQLPNNFAITLPNVTHPVTHFTRPILHAKIVAAPDLYIHVFVCHLKSKLPDFGSTYNKDHVGIAMLRSLIRQGTDALGLRTLISNAKQETPAPMIVMGDFNDIAEATPTQIVMGLAKQSIDDVDDRLFDSYRIQPQHQSLRDAAYSYIHEANYQTIDHILVSEEFNPASRMAIGEVAEVMYFNEHLTLKQAQASDHGLVLARILLHAKSC